MGDINIEFDPISIKLIVRSVQKIVVFLLEAVDDTLELVRKTIHAFEVVLRKCIELLDV